MNVRVLKAARRELADAIAYYTDISPELGTRFEIAIDNALADVTNSPMTWPLISKGRRRRLVGDFPYGIIYRVTAPEIVIAAYMHLRRHPRYWEGRS